ncbi:MAG: hypothetical protein EXS32_16975 [Opitutus sp.]|nr:hypothetical protein [Opitutus sp.]
MILRRMEPQTESAVEVARQAGFDLSLVDLNLALSYEERVLQHAAVLEFALELAAAGAAFYAQSAPVAEPTR